MKKERISTQNIYLTEGQRAFISRLAASRSPQLSVQAMARFIIDKGIAALAQEQKA